MKKFLRFAGYLVVCLVLLITVAISYIKLALPSIEADESITVEKTAARVARGKYLANNVAVCMDCHSKRDWSLYAGPMDSTGIGAGGEKFDRDMGFPGVFYAKNITPYGISSWNDGELLRAITAGVSKDGSAIFPLMNYHRFGHMDREDVYSIVAYIRTLEPVKNDIPVREVDFPVNILINTFPEEASYEPIPAKTNPIAYGKYIANASGCVDCHSRTDKGNIISGTEYGGGMEFLQPSGTITSSNITFDKETGIGNWSKEVFVQRFKAYAAVGYKPAPMRKDQLNTPMPWNMYAGMAHEDLEALYTYLASLDPITNKVEKYEMK